MQYRGNNFLYGGIDFSVPGEGGPACTHFLSPHRRLTESLLFGLLGLLVTVQAWRRVRLEGNNNQESVGRGGESHHPGARQSLLVVLAVTFGLEVGFKLSTGQVLWLLNPCHVLTVVQLYLLASPSPATRLNNALFRLHVYWLTGPLLAILFPVTFTRHIAGEVLTYWVHHLLLLLVPGYLLTTGQFSVEQSSDRAWPALALSVFSSYHWLLLQPIGLLTEVNLNNMLCPAASDPFHNTNYRIIAMSYFVLIMPLVGKSYSLLAKYLIKLMTTNNGSKEEKLS